MVCYYCYLVHKDESTTTLEHSNIADSLFNLKTLPPISSRQTEILHHRRHYHQPYHKAVGQNTLKKTDEHCRSLFNLLPSTLRPHQHHQKTPEELFSLHRQILKPGCLVILFGREMKIYR